MKLCQTLYHLFLAILTTFFVCASAQADVLVGSLPDSFSVSQSGAASYEVPISLPPSQGGLAPELGLRYSSQNGNGVLGLGWQLSGLSYITRCSTNFERDGSIDGVMFNLADQFCLGGNRLIPISGTNGANGTEYRTETESYSKIISYGSSGLGPAKFKVWHKDGLVSEYGYTSSSQINAQDATKGIAVWAINKRSDRSGNSYSVSYNESSTEGNWSVSQINLNTRSTANTRVVFNYSLRPDSLKKYYRGGFWQTLDLLDSIDVYVDGLSDPYQSYNFTYQQRQSPYPQTLLDTVQQCFSDMSCTAATTFEWQNSSFSGLDFPNVEAWGSGFSDSNKWNKTVYLATIQYVDIDGDGLMDVCGRGAAGIYCALNNGQGMLTNYKLWINEFTDANSWDDTHKNLSVRFVDVTGDGLPDVCGKSNSGIFCAKNSGNNSFVEAKLWVGSFTKNGGWTTSHKYKTIQYVDVTGDGFIDVCGKSGDGIMCAVNTQSESFSKATIWVKSFKKSDGWDKTHKYWTLSFVDVSGDGLPDVCGKASEGIHCALNNGDGASFGAPSKWLSDFKANQGWTNSERYKTLTFVDMNADGLADVCGKGGDGVVCALNNGSGTGFNAKTTWAREFMNDDGWSSPDRFKTIRFRDINGDGLVDVCGKDSTGIRCLENTGQGSGEGSLVNAGSIGGAFQSWTTEELYSTLQMVDIDGDGFVDVCGRKSSGIVCAENQMQEHSRIAKIESPSTTIDVQYRPLSDASIYTKSIGSNGANGIYKVQYPAYVVSSFSRNDGVGGLRTTTYHYQDLKYHAPARKLLGFASITSTDSTTGHTVDRRFSQDYDKRFQGTLLSEVETASNGQKISELTFSPALESGCYSDQRKTYSPYISLTTSKSWDVDGNKTGHHSVSVTMKGDCLGNIASRNTNYSAEYGIPDVQESYTYKPANKSAWLVAQPESVIVSSEGVTRETVFDSYDSKNRLLQMRSGVGVDPLTTSFIYDSFGNVQSQTVTADNISRTMTTSFHTGGLYPHFVQNAEGFKEFTAIEYDERFGLPTQIRDANNHLTEIAYDHLGRVIWQKNPDNTELNVSFSWCSGSGMPGVGCEGNELYRRVTSLTGRSPLVQYFDKYGREVRNSHKILGGTDVYQTFSFNEIGALARVSEPFSGQTVGPETSTEFDEFWRPFKTINPDGSERQITQYSGLEVSERNERGNYRITEYDPLGRLLRTVDANYLETSFKYDGFGNLTQTEVGGTYSLMTYDALGRKLSMTSDATGPNDATTPRHYYTYNALGEMITQKDPNGVVTCYAYDDLGRMIKRVENYQGTINTQAPAGCTGSSILHKVYTWDYDSATNGVGLLHRETAPDNYSKVYDYGSLSRLISEQETIKGESYTTAYSYDETTGLQDLTVYPENFATLRMYDNYGHLSKIVNADNLSKTYVHIKEMTERGQVQKYVLGDGLTTNFSYDSDTGRLLSQLSAPGSMNSMVRVQRKYSWDAMGNLLTREDLVNETQDAFSYDALNRLKTLSYTHQSGGLPVTTVETMRYFNNGNILEKPGVGTYEYGTPASQCIGKSNVASRFSDYAVSRISGASNRYFCYDKNGNMIADDQRDEIRYNANNQPTFIKKGSEVSSELSYAGNGNLVYRKDTKGSDTTKTSFVGGHYEKVDSNGTIKHKFYIEGFAVISQTGSDVSSLEEKYLYTDHLGSVVAVTDDTGNVLESMSYDAWGKRRNVLDYSYNGLALLEATMKGYTGHQQMDDVGLVHMKGRIYDPTIGRFLGQDPFVQAPWNGQSFNRYSYVFNSPLSMWDPTGYLGCAAPGSDNDGKDACGSVGSKGPSSAGGSGRVSTVSELEKEVGITVGEVSVDPNTGRTVIGVTDAPVGYEAEMEARGWTRVSGPHDTSTSGTKDKAAATPGLDGLSPESREAVGGGVARDALVKNVAQKGGGYFSNYSASDAFGDAAVAGGYALIAFDILNSFISPGPDAGLLGMALVAKYTPKQLGSASFYAKNGIGNIYSSNVVLRGNTAIYEGLSVGTARGLMGVGPKGAAELVSPLRQLLSHAQGLGAKKVNFRGYYASPEGAALGGGKLGESFSFTFPATKEGLSQFLKGLR